jgi:uncharacterized protein
MRYLFAFITLIIVSTTSVSQSKKDAIQTEKLPVKLKLMANNRGKEVVLRWAFSEPEAWRYLSTQGFWLERFELNDVTNELMNVNPTIVSGKKITPWTEDEFKAKVTPRDTFLAISGQCLYGDDKLPLEQGNNMFRQLELKSKSEENRLLFAMLAASMNAESASSLGLGIIDKDVKPGLKYIYRLRVEDDPKNRFLTDTSYYVVATDEIFTPETPMTPMLQMGDSIAVLEWTRSPFFIAYHVERSEDGKLWKRLTSKPFLNMGSSIQNDGERVTFSDLLPKNFIEYQYRLIGLTIFGDESPSSDVVSGSGRDLTPTAAPKIIFGENTKDSQVEIKWEIPNVLDLKGFWIKRGISMEGPWMALNKEPLSASSRMFIDKDSEEFGLNFYRVYSMDDHDNENGSYPIYVKMKNQKPPSIPNGLRGTIDTTGLLTIRWSKSTEPDLMGYELFYANQEDHMFIVMNDSIIRDTFFQTQISIKNLTKNMFFKIRAMDFHNALSPFSEVLKLKKPDLVPPTKPIFKNYFVDDNGILLEWVGSSSDDVIQYRLERSEDISGWKSHALLLPNVKSYIDSDVKSGQKYNYRIIAIDDAGLESTDPGKITIQAPKIRKRPDIEKLEISILKNNEGVELVWLYPEDSELYHFIVYQVLDNGSLRQLSIVPGTQKRYVDRQVARPGKTITYAVKAGHKQGGSSALFKTAPLALN